MTSRKTEVVLTSAPFALEENFGLLDFVGQYGMPLNLLHLASSLEGAGINTMIADLSSKSGSVEECAEYIVSLEPEFVGVAIHFTFLANKSLKLISLIKKLDPGIKIIAGGVHFTALAEDTMKACPGIDVGILGEAEGRIAQVVRRLKESKDPAQVEGIIFRRSGGLVMTGGGLPAEDVNKLPFPAFEKVDIRSYSPALYKEKGGVNLSLMTSRGCPYACSFCDRTVLGGRVRFYSIDYLSKEIDLLFQKFGVECFDIVDENICVTEERFRDVSALMKDKYSNYGITWGCSMRADSVDRARAASLRDAGCRSVIFGIESGSPRMLDTYNKKIDLGRLPERCGMIRDAGISLAGSFIIGGPGEDEASISETIALLKRIDLDYMFLWYFAPFPGAPIYEGIESKGVLVGDYSNRTGQHISFIPRTISREVLEDGYKRIYKAFYSKPSVVFRTIRRYGFSGIPEICGRGIRYMQRFIFN